MKNVLLGIFLTLLVLIVAFIAYIFSGSYNISQLSPHNSITRRIIGITVHHSINKRLKEIKVPALNDTAMIAEGFGHYNEMCVICHGAPGIEPSEMVKGLYPEPPIFYKSDDMPETDEAFWIIKYGIKLTSMPAFAPTHTDSNIWAITAFMLNKMNKMSPSDYQEWVKRSSGMENESGK
jgi:mono/diheme cytochrome c family protein